MSTSSAGIMTPPPNFSQIQLPPGMTLEQYKSLEGSLVTIAITVAVVSGVLMWDYFNLLPDEIKLYQTTSSNIWRTPATWAFIVLRYAGIVATLPSLFFTSIQSDHCQVAVVISQVGAVLVVASSGIIFCYRVFAVWGRNVTIHILVGLMYLTMLGCWCAVASQYHATTGPHTPFGSNCQMHPIVSWALIGYASSVAFDALILILTICKLNTNRATASKVGYLVYPLGSKSNLIKPTAVPFSTLITTTMGARVFLNLKLFNQRQARENQGLPASSSTGSHGTGYTKPAERAYRKTPTPHPAPVRPVLPLHTVDLSPDVNAGKYGAPFTGAYNSPNHSKPFEMGDFIQEPAVVR